MTVEPEEQPGTGADVDDETIRRRAYELHESGEGGSAEEKWRRAEQELRGGSDGSDAAA